MVVVDTTAVIIITTAGEMSKARGKLLAFFMLKNMP
jgi:hypothetical protein